MSKVVKLVTHKVKPGRIDDAMARWKEAKAGAKVTDFSVIACTTGGPYTNTFLVSMVYPDAKTMIEAMESHGEELKQSWRSAHAEDSPFESEEVSNWTVLDL